MWGLKDKGTAYYSLLLASLYLVQLMLHWTHFCRRRIICFGDWNLFGSVTRAIVSTSTREKTYSVSHLRPRPELCPVHKVFNWHLKIKKSAHSKRSVNLNDVYWSEQVNKLLCEELIHCVNSDNLVHVWIIDQGLEFSFPHHNRENL